MQALGEFDDHKEEKIVIKKSKPTKRSILVAQLREQSIQLVFFGLKTFIVVALFLYILHYVTGVRFSVAKFLPTEGTFSPITTFLSQADVAPSYYTIDNQPLPGFPLTDEIMVLKQGDIVIDQKQHKVILSSLDSSLYGQFEEEMWLAVMKIERKSNDILSNISEFLESTRELYAHEVIKIGNDYWFIHAITSDELIMARFVNEDDAQRFPLVWEI